MSLWSLKSVFFFNDTATTEIYTLSLHDALPILDDDVGIPGHLVGQALREGPRDVQDRKSTRLNSSHGSISYAVFCLKKKSMEAPSSARKSSESRCFASSPRNGMTIDGTVEDTIEVSASGNAALADRLESFFFNDTATTEIYTLSLHDALPICRALRRAVSRRPHVPGGHRRRRRHG